MTAPIQALFMGGFRPTQLSGAVLWLDSSDTSTLTRADVNTTVSNWYDKVASLNFSQVTAVKRPKYPGTSLNGIPGLNGVTADGTVLSCAAALLRNVAGWTIFSVEKTTQNTVGANSISVVADAGSVTTRAGLSLIVTSGFDSFYGRRNNADAAGTAPTSTQASTAAARIKSAIGSYTATTLTGYIGGVQVSQNTSWLTSGNTPNDGGDVYLFNTITLGQTWEGAIWEQIIYNRDLTLVEHAVVISYLKAKWGLT